MSEQDPETPPEDPPSTEPQVFGPLDFVSANLTSTYQPMMGATSWTIDLVLADAEGASYAVQMPASVVVTPPAPPEG